MFSWKLFPFSIAEHSNDLVACFESLEHVEGDQLMLSQILGSLKKDGVALISLPNQDQHPLEKNPHQFHFRHYRHADFIRMVPQGFSIETWYGQNVYEFTHDGVNTFHLLSEDEMCLREKVPGQVNVYVIRRQGES
jgi:SAM-dependent methyltransferase